MDANRKIWRIHVQNVTDGRRTKENSHIIYRFIRGRHRFDRSVEICRHDQTHQQHIRKQLSFIRSTYKQFYLSLFSDQHDDEKRGHDDESADQVQNDTSDEENNEDIEPNATTMHVESRNKTKENVHSNGKSRVQLRSARKHKQDNKQVSKTAAVLEQKKKKQQNGEALTHCPGSRRKQTKKMSEKSQE